MSTFEVSVYKSLQPGGIKANYNVTDDLAADIAAAGEDRVHKVFVKDLMYHSVLTALRNELSEAVEEHAKTAGTPFEWLTELRTVNGKAVQTIVEDNEDYIKRAVASNIVDVNWLSTTLQDLCNDADNAFALFAKEPERKPRAAKKLPKDIVLIVEKYSADGVLPKVAEKLGTILGRPVVADADSVGWAIKEHRAKLAAEAEARAKSDLASLMA